MEYRINREQLFNQISAWDGYIKKRIRLIACGGTAMTLLGVKESTKDIDLIVPNLKEYDYLIKIIEQLGYKSVSGSGWSSDSRFIFEFFRGKRVHTTELLESPLEEKNHFLIKEFSHIYLGVLNYYDLMISKLFRSSSIDVEDCRVLVRNKRSEIDIDALMQRYRETASYDISEEKVNKNLDHFLDVLKQEGLFDGP